AAMHLLPGRQGAVADDPDQPGIGRPLVRIIAVRPAPDPQEGVLHDILGDIGATDDAARDREHAPAGQFVEARKSSFVAGGGLGEQQRQRLERYRCRRDARGQWQWCGRLPDDPAKIEDLSHGVFSFRLTTPAGRFWMQPTLKIKAWPTCLRAASVLRR